MDLFNLTHSIYRAHPYAAERQASGNSWEGFAAGYDDQRLESLDQEFDQQDNVNPLTGYLGEFIQRPVELLAES